MNESILLYQLGARIRAYRVRKNMTQYELALHCEIEKASMSRIESGKTNLTIRTLHKICIALDVSMLDLLSQTNPLVENSI